MVKSSLYCGGPDVALGDWFLPRGSATGFTESWPQLAGRTVIGTHRGRTAVALACRLLGLGTGDEVLVPAYNCGTEIDALVYAGVTPVGYNVTRRCEIDMEDLATRRTDRTRAVYLIHYFGWEQPMAALRSWCDENGLLLIEDCALALFSDGQTGAIGRMGDAVIYSLPKSLGFTHGGLLALKSPPATGMPHLKGSENSTWFQEIRRSVRSMAFLNMERLGFYGPLVSAHRRRQSAAAVSESGPELPDMPAAYYFNPVQEADRGLHPRTAAILNSLPWQRIVRVRRENYLLLCLLLKDIPGAEPLLPELPQGVCPLSMPLWVADRDHCARALQQRGIAAYPWWAGFHRGCLDWGRFPDARSLKNRILTVPVYQGIGSRQLEEMAAIVTDVVGSNRADR